MAKDELGLENIADQDVIAFEKGLGLESTNATLDAEDDEGEDEDDLIDTDDEDEDDEDDDDDKNKDKGDLGRRGDKKDADDDEDDDDEEEDDEKKKKTDDDEDDDDDDAKDVIRTPKAASQAIKSLKSSERQMILDALAGEEDLAFTVQRNGKAVKLNVAEVLRDAASMGDVTQASARLKKQEKALAEREKQGDARFQQVIKDIEDPDTLIDMVLKSHKSPVKYLEGLVEKAGAQLAIAKENPAAFHQGQRVGKLETMFGDLIDVLKGTKKKAGADDDDADDDDQDEKGQEKKARQAYDAELQRRTGLVKIAGLDVEKVARAYGKAGHPKNFDRWLEGYADMVRDRAGRKEKVGRRREKAGGGVRRRGSGRGPDRKPQRKDRAADGATWPSRDRIVAALKEGEKKKK